MSAALTVSYDANDARRLVDFWASLLQRDVRQQYDGWLLPGEAGQLGIRFVQAHLEQRRPNLMHLHVTSTDAADQERVVATALRLGASHLDAGQLPEEGHIVLADPEGYAFCVIEPGNAFLAGCGLLGELACEGSHALGVFWSEALGWPLVWDQDEETAIQSPEGGTKVAWGGAPIEPLAGTSRQRLEVRVPAGVIDAEVERLVALGASRMGARDDGVVVLADVDGNPFHLSGPDSALT